MINDWNHKLFPKWLNSSFNKVSDYLCLLYIVHIANKKQHVLDYLSPVFKAAGVQL